jgi:glucose-6-phosphate isomerase
MKATMSFDHRIFRDPATGLVVDLEHTAHVDESGLGPALAAMAAIEGGAIANQDEGRQVGHYWLRAPNRAPEPETADEIRSVVGRILRLNAPNCNTILMIGIGGSALGPELAIDALRPSDGRRFLLIDTVDPRGMARVLGEVDPQTTLVLVASKSGVTVETRQALRIVEATFARAGVCFEDHAIAITAPNSALAELAHSWRDQFPLWSWVGGRTSVTSPVGLIPMHLCGIDIEEFLTGAREMDNWTRHPVESNPAAQLAGVWHSANKSNLAVIPYCEHLRHMGRYLQQLIMESLGKAYDRDGQAIHHGLTVYGNKGSADQHAIIQQLRDGPDDVMIHLIDCGTQRTDSPLLSDAADLQFALMAGTRSAMIEVGRSTVSITMPQLNSKSLGALIALFERTVGLAAELANINAYNQPGVEAGKQAAALHLAQIRMVQDALEVLPLTAEELANKLDMETATTWRLVTHLGSTGRAVTALGKSPSEDLFHAPVKSAK